jgi:hypothetical protein
MSRCCGLRPLLAALLAASFASAALPARADDANPAPPKIYRWIDENGIAHYTTDPSRIPGALRSKIPDAAPAPLPPAAAEAPTSTAPAPTSAPTPATPPAASEAQAPAPAPTAPGKGPDTWAGTDRGAVPARTLTTPPFSEGGAEGTAAAPPAPAAAPPGASSAPGAKSEAAPPAGSASQSALDDLDYRIASVQADIQADEKLIATRLGDSQGGGPLAAGDDARFREAALRLPERLKELKKLQEEREKLVHGSGS